jgi:hypothetical protein
MISIAYRHFPRLWWFDFTRHPEPVEERDLATNADALQIKGFRKGKR